jgi:hypothetical protein
MTARPIPGRLHFEACGPSVEWWQTDDLRFTEPFFASSLQRILARPENVRSRRRRTPPAELARAAEGARPPTAILFHISRCGSTLAAQMLAAVAENVVLSEPPLFDDILRVSRSHAGVTEADRIAWLRGASGAFMQGGSGRERLFVKLDSWHLFDFPLVERAFPGVPKLFLYREPMEVLVSLRRQTSFTLLPGTIAPHHLGLDAHQASDLSPENYAAAVLGAFFRLARTHCRELVPVAYPELVDFILHRMPDCDWSAAEREAMRGVTARHAKWPWQAFSPDDDEKRREATPALRAAIARWTTDSYATFCRAVAGHVMNA